MRAARLSTLLLSLGAIVGAAAGVGLLVGFEPSRLPPALLDLAAYKLTFIAAFALLAAGAALGRYARRARPRATVAASSAASAGSPHADRDPQRRHLTP